MDLSEMQNILRKMEFDRPIRSAVQFCSEEDGSPYDVWKIETDAGAVVLKKISLQEREVWQTFFPHGAPGTPKVYGLAAHEGQDYLLMEFFAGETLSQSSRSHWQRALDALIALQRAFWENTEQAGAGWTFEKKFASEQRWLPYMDDLAEVYHAYLTEAARVPRTLCNDDLLPFNVLVNEERAVILDWEYGGILPYPCALARLLAFGEEGTDFFFQMTRADREFALRYYYDHLLREKNIPWEEYLRTMKLFFLKEYAEWVYLARKEKDLTGANYRKYYEKCRILAGELSLSTPRGSQ